MDCFFSMRTMVLKLTSGSNGHVHETCYYITGDGTHAEG